MANLNPWFVLLLGVFIGWLAHWLLEIWFFRRERLEPMRRAEQAEAALQAERQTRQDALRARETELNRERQRSVSLEQELATLRMQITQPPAEA